MAATTFETPAPSYDEDRTSLLSRLPRVRPAALGGRLGLVLTGLGLLAIGIGWNGMAGGGGQVGGVSDLRAQLPWLVSGGILGLALVVFGAAMLIVDNARRDRARLEAKLDELVGALGQRPATAAAYPLDVPSQQQPAAAGFVAGVASYHRSDCRLVEGRADLERVGATEAEARGLRACRVCKPAASDVLSA